MKEGENLKEDVVGRGSDSGGRRGRRFLEICSSGIGGLFLICSCFVPAQAISVFLRFWDVRLWSRPRLFLTTTGTATRSAVGGFGVAEKNATRPKRGAPGILSGSA